MSASQAAPDVLEQEFLPVRARLLEIAATLDRLERSSGSVNDDPRVARIREALDVLRGDAGGGTKGDRAEQVQLIFSLPYDDAWQEKFFPAGK